MWAAFLVSAAAAALIDLLSKWWVFGRYPFQQRSEIISGFLSFFPTINLGGVFGIAQGFSAVFVVITVAMVGVLAWIFWRMGHKHLLMTIALGLLLGGALGNLWDRVLHQGVRDFIDVHLGNRWRWFPFNVADAFLCVGGAILFIFAWHDPDKKPPPKLRR